MPTLEALRTAAAEQAAALAADFVGTEHLFLAWLANARGPIVDACSAAGLTTESFHAVLAKGRKRRGRPPGGEPGQFSSHAQRVLELALERARAAGRAEPTADDLVLAIIHEPRGAIARALTEFDVKPSRLKALSTDRATRGPERTPAAARPEPEARTTVQRPPSSEPSAAVVERPPRPPRERVPREPTPPSRPVTPPPPPPEREREPPRVAKLDLQSGRRFSPWWVFYLAIPAAIWLYYTHADPLLVFIAACVGVLPLAGLMGQATEQLAERTGPTIGGLLNATFGNAAELIIAIAALRAGYIDLVKASITGSILGNLLLILGLSLLAGGTRTSTLRFNRTSAGMSAAMLALAVAGMVFPAVFHSTHPEATQLAELHFSEVVAGILIFTYFCSLVFVLKTHKSLFGGPSSADHVHPSGTWSVPRAMVALTLATIGVAVMSEILVHAVGPVTESLGVSQVFLGLIIIPIIGNAAEHGTAVLAARKGHTDLAFQIALGSSTQIALLVAPVLVFVGTFLGQGGMNLVFPPFEVVGLAVAVITSAIITLDGESHWFEGVQLLALYSMLAAAAWFI